MHDMTSINSETTIPFMNTAVKPFIVAFLALRGILGIIFLRLHYDAAVRKHPKYGVLVKSYPE